MPPEAQAARRARIEGREPRSADLEERLHTNSTTSSPPPSSDPPSVQRRPPAPPSGKRRGGPPGPRPHPRALVPPQQLRQVIACRPPRGRGWGDELHGDDPNPIPQHVAEGPPTRPGVDQDRLPRRKGPRGRTSPGATLPPGGPAGAFGPQPRALLRVLAGGSRRGQRPIRPRTRDRLGGSISTGRSAPRERQDAREGEAPVEELRQHVRNAASAHRDQTSGRQGGDKAGLGAAVTRRVTVFTIATSRGAEVAQDLRGSDRRKVVLSERFRRERWIKRRQFCWADLARDVPALSARGGESAAIGRRLREHSERLFAGWPRVRDGPRARARLRSQGALRRFAFRDDRRWGRTCGCSKTAGTCRELLAGETPLGTFGRIAGVGPTTKEAERALRPGGISRKLSGGTDSASGSRFVERVLRVVATCRQQEIPVLDDLTRCYQAQMDGQPAPSLIPSASATHAA